MIVIPMAGLSRRFSQAGYARPKYMLEAGGKSMFWHAVQSFRRYFEKLPFLFVFREIDGTGAFVAAECAAMGLADAHFVGLDAPTGGQAETVYAGLSRAGVDANEAISIFNIDTMRPQFEFSSAPEVAAADGYLEVFHGTGANWSFVRPVSTASSRVAATTEKNPVSDLCCTGLYHFRRAGDFLAAYEAERQNGPSQAGEYYVAPLYNHLIAAGRDIRYAVIERDQVIFAGVPDEYEEFRGSFT